jgi:hypothetical protein
MSSPYFTPVVKETHTLEHAALHAGDRPIEGAAHDLSHRRRQRFGDDDGAPLHVVRRVVELRVKRHGEVGRNRPRCRGPDENGEVAAGEARHARDQIALTRRRQRKFDIDRGRRVVLVLDFGFR